MTRMNQKAKNKKSRNKDSAPRVEVLENSGSMPTLSVKCNLHPEPPRQFPQGTGSARIRAIVNSHKKWANGTHLHYYFFDRDSDGEYVIMRDGSRRFVPWTGTDADKEVVRNAFRIWSDVRIGLHFEEVTDREDAEIRIGFMERDGHWSYLGRDILQYQSGLRTMNFDGPLLGVDGLDTALHEIGHTISMPHEHQNPNSGIIWNEPEVYNKLAQPPNNWDAKTTHWNILRKIPKSEVSGTEWDPDSIMHYFFEAGMIEWPERYRQEPLRPAPGLSGRDITWVRTVYPPLSPFDTWTRLERFRSHPISLSQGEQFDGVFHAKETGWHKFSTFGPTDLVLTVFEHTDDGPRFVAGEDDSGEERNAELSIRLVKGRDYIVRTRLFYNRTAGLCSIMVH